MKIGIIVGSIREGRKGADVGAWVQGRAEGRESGHDYELVDLKEFDVPLLTAPVSPMAAKKQYDDERVTAWSRAIDGYDAFVFVTPEYNHGVPGALKNAVDTLGPEWVGKPVGFVGYGSVGGSRAIESWRQVLANLSMHDVRPEVNLNIFTDWNEEGFAPAGQHVTSLTALLDALEAIGAKLA